MTHLRIYLDNFLLAHDSRDYCAHLGAFKLKIDLLGNKLWSFEIKVLKVHQSSGKALVTIEWNPDNAFEGNRKSE